MKVLFLSQGRTIDEHPGWDWSLQRLKEEGLIEDYLNIPWLGFGEKHGWLALFDKVVDETARNKFDVVYFHYFHNIKVPNPENCFRRLLLLQDRPVIITSVGDAFSDNWLKPDYPECFKVASRFADITFSTQMGKSADKMVAWGARNVVYTPNSLCPVRFKSYAIDPLTHHFDFDVVMVGSRNGGSRNPLSKYLWAARYRTRLVRALDRHFGRRFGLFGRNWEGLVSSQGPVDFNLQQRTFQRGRVLVGGNPYSYSDYYSSNRVFFEVASGIPTVELYVNRLDKILRNGDQIHFADSIDGVIAKCEELLRQDPVMLYKKAGRAAQEISARHTQYHRMKFKVDVVKRYIESGHRLNVDFPFFLPEVDLEKEKSFAIRQNEG